MHCSRSCGWQGPPTLSYKFDSIYLPVLNLEPLPQAVAVWGQRFAAMGVKGSLPDDNDFDKKLLTAGLKVAIKQESILKVHAEVVILLYLVHQGLARRIINNIRVSKLCCPGCYTLLGAKEDFKILVHGQHHKWYPWRFSCSLSQEFPTMEQLLKTRNEILTNFLEDWSEHRRRKRSITPGTHSNSSGFSAISPLERKKQKLSRGEVKEKIFAFVTALKLTNHLIFDFAMELTPFLRSLSMQVNCRYL